MQHYLSYQEYCDNRVLKYSPVTKKRITMQSDPINPTLDKEIKINMAKNLIMSNFQ